MHIDHDGRSCFVGVTITICFGLVYLFSTMDRFRLASIFYFILFYLLVDELLVLLWLTTNRFCRFSVRGEDVGKLSNGFQVRITLQ